jgi:hypothetical protein
MINGGELNLFIIRYLIGYVFGINKLCNEDTSQKIIVILICL